MLGVAYDILQYSPLHRMSQTNSIIVPITENVGPVHNEVFLLQWATSREFPMP
jgi:hypothetical protein